MPEIERIVVAHLGARMHYAVPRIIQNAGMLHHFYTDLYAPGKWSRLARALPRRWYPDGLKRLTDRSADGMSDECLTTFPALGLRYKWRQLAARNPTEHTDAHLWAGQAFGKCVIRESLTGASGVYTFRSAGLEIMRIARKSGMRTFLEQPNVPQSFMDELLTEEHILHPGWEDPPSKNLSLEKYAARERKEWAIADVILCGSAFVREAVEAVGGDSRRCVVVPYGVNVDANGHNRSLPAKPLRVLTVGSVNLRKGMPYLLNAAKLNGADAQYRVVGPVQISRAARDKLAHTVELVGAVPRSQVKHHYEWADVFLLPSICEGSATVCYEALAWGLPIICTPNAGSIVRDGVEGFVVPIRNASAISTKIDELCRNPDLYARMARCARIRYEKEGNLNAYAERLTAAITRKSTYAHV